MFSVQFNMLPELDDGGLLVMRRSPRALVLLLALAWSDKRDELRELWREDKRWEPRMSEDERERRLRLWKKAVTRTFDWVDDDSEA